MKPQVTASLDDVPVVRSFAGPEHANCAGCELRQACNGLDARPVRGEHPEDWEEGGLMIIGEGPGREEISYQRPFIGASGRLLNDLLSTLGIKRHAVWVTNATLGYPDPRYSPPKAKGETFSKRFPHATLACRSRLMAEITAARPRVIVTLGRAAFHALAGREYEKRRQVPNSCPNVRCHDDWGRKVGPIIACHSSTCDWHVVSPQDVFEAGRAEMLEWVAAGNETKRWQPDAWVRWADRELEAVGRHCPKCQKKVRCQPRMVKCATCGGTKVKVVSERFLTDDYPLVGREGAAGAVFRGDELDLAQHGVAYVIPTYHPAFCLYGSINTGTKKKQIGGQFAARVMLEHLRTAQRLLDGGEQTWRDPNVVIAGPGGVERIELQEDRRTHAARTEAVDPIEAIRTWLARPGRVSVDIETDSYDGPEAVTRIACIGFARADSHDALVVDTRMVYPKAPPATDQESRAKWRLPTEREQLFADDFLDVLEAFFDREDVETVFHNGSYDRFVIHRLWNLWVHNVGNDTMLAHNVCYPDEEHGLGFVAHELLDAPLWKGHERFKQPGAGRVHELSGYPDFTALAIYNARDTRATALVDEVLRGPIGGQGRVQAEGVEVALDDDVFNQDLGLRMTIAGIPIHAGRRDELRTAFRQELDDLTVKCRQITHRADFVPTNNGHLAWAFFAPDGPCGFPATKYGKKGEASVAKDILKPLYGQHPLVEHVLRFKTIAYYLSHYVDGADLRVGPDGRIHPSWKPGLVTGRWSSEPNVQNWPKGSAKKPELNMRRMVVAPPGRRFVGIDYSQLELRIMAALSDDPALIQLIVNADESDKLNPDKDPHSYLARAVFRDAYMNADKETRKKLRDCVKRVWYGSLYGAGAQTIMDSILDSDYEGPPLTRPFVEGVLQMIGKAFPGTQRWKDKQVRDLLRNSEVWAPRSRRHRIFPLNEAEVTIAMNFPIQSCAADLMNWRVRILDARLVDVDPTAAIILQVHDAIYIECDEDRTDAVKRLSEECLRVEWTVPGTSTPMFFDASADDAASWDAC